MSKKKPKPNAKLQAWIDARKRHRLSHVHVHMARELGMNPGKLGKIDNHDQEPWKMPLGEFIEHLYEERFGKERPDVVLTIEEVARREAEKKARKREAKLQRRLAPSVEQQSIGQTTDAENMQGSDEMSVLQ
jgi:hypothetical protein